MADNTKVEWCDATWSPITGCSKISVGCKNCYAERMSKRLAGRHGYPEAPHNFDVTWHPDKLEQPLKWKKPRRIFVCSMGDLFHKDVPFSWVRRIWSIMNRTQQHTYQILTKRSDRMHAFFDSFDDARARYGFWPLSNVWLGVTAENQAMADKRIPILLRIPAAVRFVSIEPMLETLNIWRYLDPGSMTHEEAPFEHGLNQIIVGAETGPGARPMDLGWARSIRDQCQAAGVPFFFKRNSAGNRELDGCLWEEFPE